MTKPRLLSNLPINDLTSETDYLGIIDKGDLIKTFLIGNKEQFHEIKMFSLYGEWGSGKSSLMKYLEKELKTDFDTFFFEAWEFEKDENLAMSLLEYITSKNIDPSEQLCLDILKYGGRILRGLGKSIKLNIPLFPNGPGIELDPSAFVEEISKNEELTFYKALEHFKTEFGRLEDDITKGDKPKYNIVFIDDLDRCEPEQVLNLLSAIKLFFTYGEKTIFFCGIDKKAVEQAVKTKYGEIVKANEYLEKIFDISFSMPEYDDILKLVSVYFDDRGLSYGNFNGDLNIKIAEFFKEINFTNPRRLKKVLNKYSILSSYKAILFKNEKFKDLIPNIIIPENGNFFETILTLYVLCLSEFYKNSFDVFIDLNLKCQALKLSIERKYRSNDKTDFTSEIESVVGMIKSTMFNKTFNTLYFNYFHNQEKPTYQEERIFKIVLKRQFILQFVNGNDSEFSLKSLDDPANFLNHYNASNKKIDYLFVKYIFNNFENIIQDENLSNFSLSKFKEMIDKLL